MVNNQIKWALEPYDHSKDELRLFHLFMDNFLASVCERNKNLKAASARLEAAFDACLASRKCSLMEIEQNEKSSQEGVERLLRPLATVRALREQFPTQAQGCLQKVIAAECREWVDPSVLTEPPGSHK